MSEAIKLTMDGTLLNWLKNVGDAVNSGDIVAEVEADKATVEVEAPSSGVILQLNAKPGDELKEGAEIATIGAAGEASGGAPASKPQTNGQVTTEPIRP
ncbi:MAG: dihydrolipoamide succinyltransferase, partial [Chitinophagaceae bacterium]|nr:dihydrolipoamide succinyltransferase [Anaerolineae bacterium]